MSDCPAVVPVGDDEFCRVQRLMLEHAGIKLSDGKRALVASRPARRRRALGLRSYGLYLVQLRTDPAEQTRVLDLLLTNQTSFFREPAQFAFIDTQLVTDWLEDAAAARRMPTLRVQSAGLRPLVTFHRANLHDTSQHLRGTFDLILCRNVLIYFEAGAREQVIERLIGSCCSEGHLFVGHAETLQGFPSLRPVRPTIWRRV